MALTELHIRQYPTPVSISLQLHSMRRLGDLDRQLVAARDAGFASVEGVEKHLMAASEFRTSLQRFQLNCPSAHIGMSTLLENSERIIANCLEAGILSVFVNPMPLDDPANPTNWSRAGEKLGCLAADFGRHGILLGYHNGGAGFEPLKSGRCGIEDLFRSAMGSPLKWQADIGWIRRARGNPAEWLRRLKGYLVSAHVKDVGADSDVEEGWQNVGAGLLVWPILLDAAMQSGAQSFVVEHDNPPDPLEFAKRSFSYLTKFNKGPLTT
jgi:sugar phosphate isomerase/epimerase